MGDDKTKPWWLSPRAKITVTRPSPDVYDNALAIVRDFAAVDPCAPDRDCCSFCDRDGVLMDGIDAGGAWHRETCPWLRATQLVAASHRT